MGNKKRYIIVLLIILLLAGGGIYLGLRYLNSNPVYTEYEVTNSTDRADSKSAGYIKYCEGFIRYSRDGITYYNSDNVPQWNTPYQFQQPYVDIRGEYCAVAEIGGSQIHVFNKSGNIMSVDTVLTIVTVSVSERGYVAVVLKDASAEYIEMYDTNGEKVYHIKSSIEGEGTPVDISVSDDAQKLAVSYATVDNGQINTSITFYNFGEVGKNEAERLVGGYDEYKGMLVPVVQFVNDSTVVGFGTGKVSIFTITQYPKLIADIIPKSDIHGIFYSEKYIGLIYVNNEQGSPYKISVYDLNGVNVFELGIATNYKEYLFVEDNILMYDDNDVMLVGLNGTVRFNYTFETAIDALIPVSGIDVYDYISSRKVQKIQLK